MANNLRGNSALSDIQLEEALAKTSLERGMFARLLPLLKPVKGWVIGAVIIEALLVGAIFVRPWLVGKVIDDGLAPSAQGVNINYPVIAWIAGALLLTWAARFIFAGIGQYLAGRAAIEVINQLRVRVFSHVQQLSVGYFDRTKAGRITARADSDVNALEPLLIQCPPELLSALLRCLLAGIMLWFISPLLLARVVAVVPIMALATIAYFRIAPLGVTAELGSIARTLGSKARALPERLEGLDGFSGCATAVKDALLSNNGVFIIGLVLASFASALFSRQFKLEPTHLSKSLRHLVGGILMGWASMTALGCTVGTLLSGIMAGALSGWIFALFCIIGLYFTLLLRARVRWLR